MFRALYRRWGTIRGYFPLTNLGVVVAALGLLAFFQFGVPYEDYVVQLASVMAVTLCIAGVLLVLFGVLLVRQALVAHERKLGPKKDPIHFEAHRGFGQGLELPAWRWLPLLDIRWEWESPSGFRLELARIEDRVVEQVESELRARGEQIRRRFVIEDGFGLARLSFTRTEARSVRVLPWTGELDRSPLLRSLASGDELPHPAGELVGDRVDMRRYVPGDPLRLVLWKVYARTRQLMVRTPERSLSPSVRIAAYLPATKGDEPAAAAAKVAIDAGLLGEGWVFSTDGAERSADDPAAAHELLASSRLHQGTPRGDGAGLEAFIAAESRTETPKLVLFLPGRKGPWLERVIAAIRQHRGRVSAVVVTDRVLEGEEHEALLERVLKVPAERDPGADAETTGAELREVCQSLVSAGAEVMAFERPTGRTLQGAVAGMRRVA